MRLTQVGRALQQLGIEHIAAYSPEARGRSERMFDTLQNRLPKELALAGITEVENANRFIRDTYLPQHNARFAKAAEIEERAFVEVADKALLAEILCIHESHVVSRDNTVSCGRRSLQLPQTKARPHYVKANVTLKRYPDASLAVFHGPKLLARYSHEGQILDLQQRVAA